MASLLGVPAHKLVLSEEGDHALLIDGFRYAGTIEDAIRSPSHRMKSVEYLLTHAHADHYTGLKADWQRGPVYCTKITARLAACLLGMDTSSFVVLTMEETTTLPSGTRVTPVDANHCPGAAMFLIEMPSGRKIVHTGDFRMDKSMLQCPILARFRGCDELYLDTTYCDKKHTFPPQEEAVDFVASRILKCLREDEKLRQDGAELEGSEVPRRLYLISTYVIGKERIFKEIARRCNVSIYASQRKSSILASVEDLLPEGLITSDPNSTPVHLVPWNGFLGDTWPYFRYVLGF